VAVRSALPDPKACAEPDAMLVIAKLLHLIAAMLWLGGMGFVLLALRPAAAASLAPAWRLPLLAAAMRRFFVVVWLCIGVLLTSGLFLATAVGPGPMPLGWRVMACIGLLMSALFALLFFVPFRRLQRAVAAKDWPAGAVQARLVAMLVIANFVLGWLAVIAVRVLA